METVTIVASRDPFFSDAGLMVVAAVMIAAVAWLVATRLRAPRSRGSGSQA